MLTVFVHVNLDRLGHFAEHRRGLARRRDQRRRLVVTLFEVLVQGQVAVEQRARLRNFPVGEIRDDLRDELNHLQVVQVRQEPRRLRE